MSGWHHKLKQHSGGWYPLRLVGQKVKRLTEGGTRAKVLPQSCYGKAGLIANESQTGGDFLRAEWGWWGSDSFTLMDQPPLQQQWNFRIVIWTWLTLYPNPLQAAVCSCRAVSWPVLFPRNSHTHGMSIGLSHGYSCCWSVPFALKLPASHKSVAVSRMILVHMRNHHINTVLRKLEVILCGEGKCL